MFISKHLPYILGLLFLCAACGVETRHVPQVEQGVMDLTNWNFERDGNITLDGDWEFYWGKIYAPADFKRDTAPEMTGYMHVPATWNTHAIKGREFPGKGVATYRMTVRSNTPLKILAFKLEDASSSYNVFVNNELVGSNGVISSNPDSMKADYRPMVRAFNKTSSDLEVVAQVANNFHSRGGLWSSITLGAQDKILQSRENSAIYNLFLIGVMFILFIYHVWIYLFRKSEKAALWFGMVCFALLARTMVTNEKFLYVLFPSFPMNIGLRIEYMSMLCGTFSFAMLFYYLFPEECSPGILRLIIILSAAGVLTIGLAQTSFYTQLLFAYQLHIILVGMYCVYVTVRSTLNKRHGSVPFLVSLCILMACVVNDILHSQLLINTAFFTPYGFVLAVLAQAYSLASRISFAFETIEQLSVGLEIKVEERTFELKAEKKKSDDLLHNILPVEVANELRQKGTSEAKKYENVSVLFTDFVGFTSISERLSPEELVSEIDHCFKEFDQIIDRNGLEKIKTIGDAYLAVCGLPNLDENHAQKVIQAALEIQEFMQPATAQAPAAGSTATQAGADSRTVANSIFRIRIGVHSGPVIAGIVGSKKFAYDIWGDTVNTASRMESNSETGKINISRATYELIKDRFMCEHRGKIGAKNKGEIDMYFVNASPMLL